MRPRNSSSPSASHLTRSLVRYRRPPASSPKPSGTTFTAVISPRTRRPHQPPPPPNNSSPPPPPATGAPHPPDPSPRAFEVGPPIFTLSPLSSARETVAQIVV